MDSSILPKDEIWFLRVCHHISNVDYNRFKDGRMTVESDPNSTKLSTSRNDEVIDQVRTSVMQDRRVTVRELAEEEGISTGFLYIPF
jgi:hypothetical protein